MREEHYRFVRHHMLPGWSQPRLEKAQAVIMGSGALGNMVAQSLALAGVGHLILCDPDHVEFSNLNRCPLFRETDVGRLKVEVAASALRILAPGISVVTRTAPLAIGVGLAELRDTDLIISCLDSRTARLELAGRCGLVRAPWIDGATGPWDGEVRPYLIPDGPCYGCGRTNAQRAESDVPISCGVVAETGAEGASAPISAMIGAQMALLAVRFLMGLETPGEILVLDGIRGTVSQVTQHRDPECPFHSSLPAAVERLSVGSGDSITHLLQALPQNRDPLAWTPVRIHAFCLACGFTDLTPAITTAKKCPHCGNALRIRTTLELRSVRGDVPLSGIGIPPREILALRGPAGMEFIELDS